MPWIKETELNDAKGELKEIYDEIISTRGKLSNILKIHSLNPKAMKNHLDLYLSIMFNKSTLKREDKEIIAVVVSSANKCDYCINHHKEALMHYWKNPLKLQALIQQNLETAKLSDKQQAIASYAIKLTINPNEMNESDIKNLHQNGFTDEEILDITLIVSYFNFVNRIVLGLGVEFTEKEMKGYKY
jgi:uncharacterized peroxidase-related enzyme